MANACVFCGDDKRGLTLEHVFSDWISDVLDVRGQQGSNARYTNRNELPRQWGSPAFQWQVRVLCSDCNNKWLGGIEGQVRKILGPMILGGQEQLTPQSQRLLAFWAVKTALMAAHLDPSAQLIPRTEYTALRATEKPSKRTRVGIAHRPMPIGTEQFPLGELAISNVGRLIDSDGRHGDEIIAAIGAGGRMWRCTFGIGCVVFQVFGHDMPFEVALTVSPASPLVYIWPTVRNVAFPSGLGLGPIGDVLTLHGPMR